MARAAIKGLPAEQYADIWRHAVELQKTHLNTTIDIKYFPRPNSQSKPKFMRFYCFLGPLKREFKEECWPLLALDSYCTKGTYPGQLLTAIGANLNNG